MNATSQLGPDSQIFVDPMVDRGALFLSERVKSCRLFTNEDPEDLHSIAVNLGLCRHFYETKGRVSYYVILGDQMRDAVITLGARPVGMDQAVMMFDRMAGVNSECLTPLEGCCA